MAKDFKFQIRNISVQEAMQWKREAEKEGTWIAKRELNWAEKVRAKIEAPKACPIALVREKGRCAWRGEDANGWRWVCNNNIVRNTKTGEVMMTCSYHAVHCIMPHPMGELYQIEMPNEFALCSNHFIGVYDYQPHQFITPWVVPGVIRKIRKREVNNHLKLFILSLFNHLKLLLSFFNHLQLLLYCTAFIKAKTFSSTI